MEFTGKLVYLSFICIVHGQISQKAQYAYVPVPTLNYEQISKILQSPLFRTNPKPSASESISSYLPIKYNSEELKEVNEEAEINDPSIPSPSFKLEVPKPDAVDSYSSNKPILEPSQMFHLYQSIPEINQRTVFKEYKQINPLSKQLDLPLPDASVIKYPSALSTELQPPLFEPFTLEYGDFSQFRNDHVNNLPASTFNSEHPKSESIKPSQLPTNTFPKKYDSNIHESKPKKLSKNIPITVNEGSLKKLAKPQKFTLASNPQINKNYEKQKQKFQDAQNKLRSKKEYEAQKELEAIDTNDKSELVASETGFNANQHSIASFAAPSHDIGFKDVSHGAGGERTEFQMHGQHGPHSYKFGYDTGEGKNRQFRYEERDNDGYVKGHYGFYNKQGKLQIVNYDADPHHGFHAEIGKS